MQPFKKRYPRRIKCLRCGKPFLSRGPHNRICRRCKYDRDFQIQSAMMARYALHGNPDIPH